MIKSENDINEETNQNLEEEEYSESEIVEDTKQEDNSTLFRETSDNTAELNTIRKFISSSNLDMNINSSFYSNRKIDVERLTEYLNKNSNHGLTGLKNLGNSCYINTIIQCLSHTLDLSYYFLSKMYTKEINTVNNENTKKGLKPGQVSNLFYKILNSLWVLNDKSYVPTELRYLISNSIAQFNNTNQQDANEFFLYFLDLLHNDLKCTREEDSSQYKDTILPKQPNESDVSVSIRFWNEYKKENNSIIVDLFHGQLKNTIICLACEKEHVTFEPFLTLPLAIPNLKRVDIVIVPAINIKSTIKLTMFISEVTLFIDLQMYLNKYLSRRLSSIRILLFNGTTGNAKFVKNGENVYHISKKGTIIVYEIDESTSEGNDFYPIIALIKDSTGFVDNVIDLMDNERGDKESINTSSATIPTMKSFSYPRLFPIASYASIKDLRIKIYGLMRRYFPFTSRSGSYDKILKDYNDNCSLDEVEYEKVISEEYDRIFHSQEDTSYLSKFPYVVYLVSLKAESKKILLFSNNHEDYKKIFNDNQKIEKLIDQIKSGYKLVIEINSSITNEEFSLKVAMNKMIMITNKLAENEFTRTVNLQDCLDHFILREKLEKGNEWYCDRCKKNQNAMRKVDLFYLPKYLILYLKRFQSKMLGKSKVQLLKNNARVTYPVNDLILDNYCTVNDPKPNYDLYSVCQHSGSTEGGHYATACRNFGKWHEFDDASVFPSDEDIIVSPEGYMLFYRRKEKNK